MTLSGPSAPSRPQPSTGRAVASFPLRLGLICDYAEENWPSMDLVAEMLWEHLQRPRRPGVGWPTSVSDRSLSHRSDIHVERIRPSMYRRLTRIPFIAKSQVAFNADRLLNRSWDYPRHLRSRVRDFDYFHICDHSYAHLVHELPADRTGVYCHDLDCFRCLLNPCAEPRPRWFRAMSRRILRGLQKAAVVFCSTRITQQRIRQLALVDPARLIYAPYGISLEFTPSLQMASGASHRPNSGEDPFFLHVGSCIPRKRIDVLLEVFAGVKSQFPQLRLVQVGGIWTRDQQEQIQRLGIASAIRQQSGIDRWTLSDLYRQARVVLQPSEMEGFGLPVLEALACGAVVVASDIPALREVGGVGAIYCSVADIPQWVDTINKLILDPAVAPDRARRIDQARRFSWEKHATVILDAYRRLCK